MHNTQQDQGIAINKLREQLESAGISTAEWGRGKAKTLAHLVKEIAEGETVLKRDESGKLMRSVVFGGADVFYKSPEGDIFRLIEEKQVFNDGRERIRDLGHAVSEKMKANEEPTKAMIRGISEELGIIGGVKIILDGSSEEIIDSPSYPGLSSHYLKHKFHAFLNDEQYKSEGYVERQHDKSTYFIWEKQNS